MIQQVMDEFERRCNRAIDALQKELGRIRTGRANVQILDGVKVNWYGQQTPISHVASIQIPDPRLIVIKPWDKSIMGEIQKAIQSADLGLTPQSDGEVVRLPIPVLSEERRKELVRIVKSKCEEIKVSIRNARRDANESLKTMQKEKSLSEDELHRLLDDIQKGTSKFMEKVEQMREDKEKEIMEF
jgi:ribosome recycling factor